MTHGVMVSWKSKVSRVGRALGSSGLFKGAGPAYQPFAAGVDPGSISVSESYHDGFATCVRSVAVAGVFVAMASEGAFSVPTLPGFEALSVAVAYARHSGRRL